MLTFLDMPNRRKLRNYLKREEITKYMDKFGHDSMYVKNKKHWP